MGLAVEQSDVKRFEFLKLGNLTRLPTGRPIKFMLFREMRLSQRYYWGYGSIN